MHEVAQFFNKLLLFRWFWFTRDSRLKELVQCLRERGFNFRKFQDIVGYFPHDWRLIFQAIIHRSYLQHLSFKWDSNERLEFLGDAVLNFLIAEQLFELYPDMEEGYLTKLRSRLVNRRILAQRARELNLSDYLLLSTSAAQSIGSGAESILADAFESLIGACYLDGGLKAARTFVRKNLMNALQTVLRDNNYKSGLLEYAQAHDLGIPHYLVTREEGPEHDRRFTIEVFLGSQSYGSGSGRSKKDAEQAAAAQALERIQQKEETLQTQYEPTKPSK